MAGRSVGTPGLCPVTAVTAAFRNRPRKCTPAQPVWQDGPCVLGGLPRPSRVPPCTPVPAPGSHRGGDKGTAGGGISAHQDFSWNLPQALPRRIPQQPCAATTYLFSPSVVFIGRLLHARSCSRCWDHSSDSLPSVPIVNETVQPRSRGRRQDGPFEGWRCLRDWQVRPNKFWGSPGHPLRAAGPGQTCQPL